MPPAGFETISSRHSTSLPRLRQSVANNGAAYALPPPPPQPLQSVGTLRMQTEGVRGRYIKGTTIEKPPNYEGDAWRAILLHPMNVLVGFLPLGLAAWWWRWGDLYVFWFNFLAMLPLARILGDATEELAVSLKNDMLAGLVNATFGNVVEMVITIQTLRAGLFDVVKATLLGSVLSNTLLVLGMSFLCGGLVTSKGKDKNNEEPNTNGETAAMQAFRQSQVGPVDLFEKDGFADDTGFAQEKIQSFSVLGALVNCSMLLTSTLAFTLITVFRGVTRTDDPELNDRYDTEILLPVSRISSIIIMLAYVAYIFFQLVTHREAMNSDGGGEEEEEEGGDQGHLPLSHSVFLLFATTALVSLSSELLVNSIEGVTQKGHMTDSFIGIILLPIVGNACEHLTAVRFAMQDKMGLSVSIAIGSSTQIALFVVPFSVLAGWAIGSRMDLNFGTLNTSVVTLSVVVVLSMVVDGQSNWLQGYLLCSVYAIIAVMYYYLPDQKLQHYSAAHGY